MTVRWKPPKRVCLIQNTPSVLVSEKGIAVQKGYTVIRKHCE